jgi:hypothetical protein
MLRCTVVAVPTTSSHNPYLPCRPAAGLPPDHGRLLFEGRQLQDERTISEYGLDKAAASLAADGLGKLPTIFLLLRLRGGMYHRTSGRDDNANLAEQPLTHTEVRLRPVCRCR